MNKQNLLRKALMGVLVMAVAGTLGSCGISSEDLAEDMPALIYEAEEGELAGSAKVESSKTGYSGSGYVGGIAQEGDTCTFIVNVPRDGLYDLSFMAASNGYKENFVYLNGDKLGNIITDNNEFLPSLFRRVYMVQGENKITIEKYWGWVELDYLAITQSPTLDKDFYEVSAQLSNPNADDNAKRLMSYLCDIYGDYFLSGQYCDTGMYGTEMAGIWKATGGTYPAVLGLDFIEYSPSRAAAGSTSKATEYAIEFWEKGGIVTFCWHWNAPEPYLEDIWWNGFYEQYVSIDLEKIMNGEDPEGYELLLQDMDAIATQLQILEDAGVPILWRPLHEASGGWFWWGDAGAEAYKKLWVLMYDKFTYEYELNNLIWLWNGQNGEWYPGDEYVDIIGEDIYAGEKVYASQIEKYMQANDYTDANKMIVLSETGTLFDPDLAIRDGAMWGFFATWGGEFVSENSVFIDYSSQYTEEEMLLKIYRHENVITLDEIPDLKSYKIRKDAK